MALEIGARLDSHELVSLIGRGGMGEVWLACDTRLGRTVALKLLPPDLTADEPRRARFQREARAASGLNHPNICTIYSLGDAADGRLYLTMEYVRGETLRQRLSQHQALTLVDALGISAAIGSALCSAHAERIVHRDIKPENVMIRRDGLVKVLDFGLAKLVEPAPAEEALDRTTELGEHRTHPGTVLGTPAYMSPEQARGDAVDHRTDIWSLGIVTFEMIAGHVPFRGRSSSDVLAAILVREPPPLARFEPDAPLELQRIISKALRKNPDARYQTAKDLQLDLQALCDDLKSHAKSGPIEPIEPIEMERATAKRTTSAPVTADADGDGASAETVALEAPPLVARVRAIPARGLIAMGVIAIASIAFALIATSLGGWRWRLISRRSAAESPTQAASGSGSANGTASTVASIPARRTLTRLTLGPGLQTDATWSPDGRFIAYASDRRGNFDIWVQSVAGGDPVQVTKGIAEDTQPDWSPDGNRLVFRSERDGGGLYIVPVLGGAEQRLTSAGQEPRWSPDGKQLLFFGGQLGPNVSTAPLQVIAADGGASTDVWPDFVSIHAAGWHPDGRISALGVHRTLGRGFFTGHLNGKDLVKATVLPELRAQIGNLEQNGLMRFRWDSSGRAVFFEINTNGVQNLWKMFIDPRTMTVHAAEPLTAGANLDTRAAPSPDGTRVAYTSLSESVRLWHLPIVASTGRVTGKGEPFTEEGARVATSDMSPDGRRVSYTLHRSGSTRGELWITDLTNGEHRLLASGDWHRSSAYWSRDGRQLAYMRFSRRDASYDASQELAVIDLEGHERVVAYDRPPRGQPLLIPFDWTPDGTQILASTRPSPAASGGLALWSSSSSASSSPSSSSTSATASAPLRIVAADPRYNLWQGRFSPDGRWVAFVFVATDGRQYPGVAITAADPLQDSSSPPDAGLPARWHRVAPDQLFVDKPRWSPDGRLLYFIARGPGSRFNVWATRIAPATGMPIGAPFQITHFDRPDLLISPEIEQAEMSVSASRLVLTMKKVTGSIWLLDGLGVH
jgi:serine/threonine protein kinase/Tol biopolymer transport system component